MSNDLYENEIAIIGFAGRFPGADNVDQYWANLCAGVPGIQHFSADELRAMGVSDALLDNPNFVKAGAPLRDPDKFDSTFFGYSPREAELIDPQQRVFLEVAWHTLEAAGYNPFAFNGLIGVYAGMGLSTYLLDEVMAAAADLNQVQTTLAMMGNDKDFLSTRVAYHLDLRGPGVNVQTGCSTSLVALHLAREALLNYECDMALAGGCTILTPRRTGYLYQEGGTASPDGSCRAFDKDAAGTLFGSGAGAVLLKRLDEAINDNDTIYAVIRGTAINNDGTQKVGFTAPGVVGQMRVILQAQANAGVRPDQISYIETHGTATPLGDLIEIEALTKAFQTQTEQRQYCAIGSVKTSIGHLDTAAGIAGLIKTILSLHHKKLVPGLNFKTPNPHINFEDTPFFVNTELRDWDDTAPRIAGVSAFGFGGTNAHVILQAYDQPAEQTPARPWHLLTISARTTGALERYTQSYINYLQSDHPRLFANIAYTTRMGRTPFEHRCFVIAQDARQAAHMLQTRDQAHTATGHVTDSTPPVVFMFTGYGNRYLDMTLGLYDVEPVFRQRLDECADILTVLLGDDIREIMYSDYRHIPDDIHQPAPGSSLNLRRMLGRHTRDERNPPPLKRDNLAVEYAITVSIGYALAHLWMSAGITPETLIGHSLGEYLAAHFAGVMSLEDVLYLIVQRAHLIQELPEGDMMAVPWPADEVQALLQDGLSIAAINSDSVTVVAGQQTELARLEALLRLSGVECRYLNAGYAFHSHMMQSIVEPFTAIVEKITLHAPHTPYISNLTGTWITDDQATSPAYYGRHLVAPVQFYDGLQTLAQTPAPVMLEVGVGQSLAVLTEQCRMQQPSLYHSSLSSVRAAFDNRLPDSAFFLKHLGDLFNAGLAVDWQSRSQHETRQRVRVPQYPFEKQTHWIQSSAAARQPAATGKQHTLQNWTYLHAWEPFTPRRNNAIEIHRKTWVLICHPSDFSAHLADIIETHFEGTVLHVVPAAGYHSKADNHYEVRLTSDDFFQLFATLERQNQLPHFILSLIDLTAADTRQPELFSTGYNGLIACVQGLTGVSPAHSAQFHILSNHTAKIETNDRLIEQKAAVEALCMVIPQEYTHLSCKLLDIPYPPVNASTLLEQIFHDIRYPAQHPFLAYRGSQRYVRAYQPYPLHLDDDPRRTLRQNGVYLMTGAYGLVGRAISSLLAEEWNARLVLLSRTPLPDTDKWTTWLVNHDEANTMTHRIRFIQSLQERGTQVLPVTADVTDKQALERVVAEARDHFGEINGIVHLAGVTGVDAFAMLPDITPALSRQKARAKIQGLYNLHAIFKDDKLDFRLVASSVASVLGGIGLGVYTAANLLQDVFVEKINTEPDSCAWLSINFEEWKEDTGEKTTSMSKYGLSYSEGQEIVRRILYQAPDGRIAIFTGDLEERLDLWLYQRAQPTNKKNAPVQTLIERDDLYLETPYIKPKTPTQERLVHIWGELLGINQIGLQDNFYDLGGHSLLATQIMSRVKTIFHVEMSLVTLFNRPNIAALAEEIENQQQQSTAPDDFPLERSENRDNIPLASSQTGLWILARLSDNDALHNIIDAVYLHGSLNADYLERAINHLIEAHEILRTSFQAGADGMPVQIIEACQHFAIERIDISHLSAAEQEQAIQTLSEDIARTPFEITQPPLLRAHLVYINPQKHLFILTTHHLIADAWTMGIILRDIIDLYEAYRSGQTPVYPAPKIQYVDFTLWEQARAESEQQQRQLAYWKDQLSNLPHRLEIPTDYPRPTVRTFEAANEVFMLSSTLVNTLHTLAKEEDATLFMVLLAGYHTLLHSYTREDDIFIGAPIAHRTRSELENLVGLFVNPVILRSDFSQPMTFRDLIRQMKAVTLAAYDNQDVAFERIVKHLQPERHLEHHPLFQVLLALQNVPFPAFKLGDVQMEPHIMPIRYTKYDISVLLRAYQGGLLGVVEYATELFKASTIRHFITHFEKVLHYMVAHPGQSAHYVPLVTDDELQRYAAHSVTTDYPDNKTLAWYFYQQAARTPDQVAFIYNNQTITYRTLDQRSNQVAHQLLAHGVQPGSIVGFQMERSIDLMIALLAILKTGAAYLSLDPTYPRKRLELMMTQTDMSVVITRQRYAPELDVEHVILIDDETTLNRYPVERPRVTIPPEIPVFVTFTSGSTGTPKGVVVTWQGMLNRLHWMWNAYPFTPDEVTCQKTSLNFADSFWEIFGSLLQGYPNVIIGDDDLLDITTFVDILAEYRVSRLVLVPSFLKVLLATHETLTTKLSSLRYCTSSGEAIGSDLCRTFYEQLPHTRLLNIYGTSEVSADVTVYEMPDTITESDKALIGQPIDNVQIYILDDSMRPVPAGIIGHIYVGGDILAHGYYNQPAMTAERFLPNPFSNTPGGRLFHTGDLGRYLEDGNIEFLGRKDQLVKIRGFRIELPEIEATLKLHDRVHDAIVAVHERTPDDKHLVAYIIADDDRVTIADMHNHLKAYLPPYSLPSSYTLLENFPLTPTGKINRRTLPEPVYQTTNPITRQAPESAVEHVLFDVWAAELGRTDFGVTDNFFELGGHSLIAIKIIHQINELFDTQVAIKGLFKHPSIRGFVRVLQDTIPTDQLETHAKLVQQVRQMSEDEVKNYLNTQD